MTWESQAAQGYVEHHYCSSLWCMPSRRHLSFERASRTPPACECIHRDCATIGLSNGKTAVLPLVAFRVPFVTANLPTYACNIHGNRFDWTQLVQCCLGGLGSQGSSVGAT